MGELFSIFKMMGAQSSRLKTADDAIKYIFDERKTENELQGEQYLSLLQPQQAWHFLDEENHENSRQFIHGMICPGGKQSVADLMTMMKELCGYYEEYAMLYAVHNDKPSHVHAHFLIHPINVITRKRWQQSPKQFYQLLDFLNESLKKYGFTDRGTLGNTYEHGSDTRRRTGKQPCTQRIHPQPGRRHRLHNEERQEARHRQHGQGRSTG